MAAIAVVAEQHDLFAVEVELGVVEVGISRNDRAGQVAHLRLGRFAHVDDDLITGIALAQTLD